MDSFEKKKHLSFCSKYRYALELDFLLIHKKKGKIMKARIVYDLRTGLKNVQLTDNLDSSDQVCPN